MSDKSSNKLDQLFQQGVEQHDFEYNASAWDQMELLIEKDRRRKRLLWWIGAVGLVIFVGLIWIIPVMNADEYTSSSHLNIGDANLAQQDLDNEKQSRSEFSLSDNISNITADKADIDLTNTARTQDDNIDLNTLGNPDQLNSPSVTTPNHKSATEAPLDREVAKTPKSEHRVNSGEIDTDSDRDKTRSVSPQMNTNYSRTEEVILANGANDLADTALPNDEDQIREHMPDAKIYTLALKPLIVDTLKNRPIVLSDKQLEQILYPNVNKSPGELLIGASISGELTSIGGSDFSDLNFRYGGHVEYRFKRWFGLSLGANYIRKSYEAGEGEYIPPKGFWTRKIPPNYTEGESSILEIPLLFGYYHRGYRNSGFYSQLGLTSYFLLKESYNYFYELNDPDLIREWGTENENQHWFGIAQVAVGYNHHLSSKLSLQVAPYFQIPLTGIGHGNLNMWTLGLQLRVNFRAL